MAVELTTTKHAHIDTVLTNMQDELNSASPNLSLVDATLIDLKASHGVVATATQKADYNLLIAELDAQKAALTATAIP
jgi:hypothetical protein